MRITGRMLSTAAIATALTVGLVGAGLAQDATPDAGEDTASPAFPNHFHLGTCDELDPAPAYPLADLTFPEWVAPLSGDSDASVEVIVPEPGEFGNAPIPAAVATTELQVPLADIVSGGHALNVHDAADPSSYVACGNIGGVPDDRGDLFVGLGEHEGSGYSGVAWLHDNGGSTTVVVFLTHPAAQPAIAEGLAEMVSAAATEEALSATPEMAPAATPEMETDSAPEATPVT
jgi:hypothetical protein